MCGWTYSLRTAGVRGRRVWGGGENGEKYWFFCKITYFHIPFTEERTTQLLGLLVKNFGLTTFKNWQLEAIKAVIKGKNALIIQPTGSGKSLCFSFPPFATEKLSIVITPTISLMADQVKSLMEHGISATHLGGGKKDFEVLPGLQSGKYRVLFVTPEKLFMPNGQPYQHFITMASMGKIGLLAIDEAHLVMSWSSFRSVLWCFNYLITCFEFPYIWF